MDGRGVRREVNVKERKECNKEGRKRWDRMKNKLEGSKTRQADI